MLKLIRARDKTPIYLKESAITAVTAPWPQAGWIDEGNAEVHVMPNLSVQVMETPEEVIGRFSPPLEIR
jgi:hypothetical protein